MVSKGLAGVLEHAAARTRRGAETTNPARGRWNMTTWVSYLRIVCPVDRGSLPRAFLLAAALLVGCPLVWPAHASAPDAGAAESGMLAAVAAPHFAIATENEASARAALDVMKHGGNATD